LKQWLLLEDGSAEDLLDFAEAAVNTKLLADDGNQHVDADRHPYLSLDGVRRRAREGLDLQVLFDPLEEELYLPAALVELGDDECRQAEVVGEKDQSSVTLGIMIADVT
jgi:hypothetical protein